MSIQRPYIHVFQLCSIKTRVLLYNDVRLKDLLHRRTHLTRVELVQILVNPLLHVQPLLQFLPVVLHGNAGVPLRDMTPVIRRKVRIWWVHVLMFLQVRAGPVCCHFWCGAPSLSGLVWLVGGDGGAHPGGQEITFFSTFSTEVLYIRTEWIHCIKAWWHILMIVECARLFSDLFSCMSFSTIKW